MRRPVCALALAGALFAAEPASAGPSWLEPVPLSDQAAAAPAAGLAAPGDAVTVWTRSGAVEARVRAPGLGYAPTVQLGNTDGPPADVDVAPDGTAVAAWPQGQGIAFAVRAPGAGFGPTQVLPGSGQVTAIRVIVNAAGDALIAYVRGQAYAVIRPAGGSPGQVATLSTSPACDLDAALGANGQAAVAWRDCGNGATPIRAARRTESAWDRVEVASGTNPALAVDADGMAVVAWDNAGAVRAAAAPPGAAFGSPRTLSEGVAGQPALAATTDGVWAAWRSTAASRIMASRRPTGGEFPAPQGAQAVSPDGVAAEAPALAGAGDGSVVAAWVRAADGAQRVEHARRAPGAPGFAPSSLVSAASAATGALDLDADGDGNVLAAYVRGGVATAQTLDAAGPRLTDVQVREAGHALDAYPFSFTPVDAWSAVASSAFDFGDGTTAPGPRAEHAFASQGERTVTLSATDALGNVSSAARRFVAAPPLDRTAPVLSAVRMDATRFKRTTKETAVVAAVRRGTRFRYTLSEPAQVNVFFERVLIGRRRGTVCRRGNRRGKTCRIYEPVGLITRSHKVAGPVSAAFTGRIVGRSGPLRVLDVFFKPGRYRATIVAADANRNVSKPEQLAFTVLR